jgi:hypothetical protein
VADGHGAGLRKLAGASSKEACAVIGTTIGEEAQVDYGHGPMVRLTGQS